MDKYEASAGILGLNQQTLTVVVVIFVLMFLYMVYNVVVAITFPVRLACKIFCCCCRRSVLVFTDDEDALLG